MSDISSTLRSNLSHFISVFEPWASKLSMDLQSHHSLHQSVMSDSHHTKEELSELSNTLKSNELSINKQMESNEILLSSLTTQMSSLSHQSDVLLPNLHQVIQGKYQTLTQQMEEMQSKMEKRSELQREGEKSIKREMDWYNNKLGLFFESENVRVEKEKEKDNQENNENPNDENVDTENQYNDSNSTELSVLRITFIYLSHLYPTKEYSVYIMINDRNEYEMVRSQRIVQGKRRSQKDMGIVVSSKLETDAEDKILDLVSDVNENNNFRIFIQKVRREMMKRARKEDEEMMNIMGKKEKEKEREVMMGGKWK